MADDDLVVGLHCPKCDHDGARLFIGSATVVTVKCVRCDHVWSVDTNTVAPDIRQQVDAAIAATPK
jgi:Zn ribbon nucleic-acid-binding protein